MQVFIRFALFEADRSTQPFPFKPHVSATPHVGLTEWHLSEVLCLTRANLIGPLRRPYQSGNRKYPMFFLHRPFTTLHDIVRCSSIRGQGRLYMIALCRARKWGNNARDVGASSRDIEGSLGRDLTWNAIGKLKILSRKLPFPTWEK